MISSLLMLPFGLPPRVAYSYLKAGRTAKSNRQKKAVKWSEVNVHKCTQRRWVMEVREQSCLFMCDINQADCLKGQTVEMCSHTHELGRAHNQTVTDTVARVRVD